MYNICLLELYYTDEGGTPDGDTHFGNAMQLAESSVTNFKEETAIIFLTDGQAVDGKASNDDLDKYANIKNVAASERIARLGKNCKRFIFYPIQFGTGFWTKLFLGSALEKMANAAKTSVINVDTGKTNSKNVKDALKQTVNLTVHLEIIATKIADASLLAFNEQS